MTSRQLQLEARQIKEERASCKKIFSTLSRIEGSPASAARAEQFRERWEEALEKSADLLGRTLSHAAELEDGNRALRSELRDMEAANKRLLRQLQQQFGFVPKSMRTEKKRATEGTGGLPGGDTPPEGSPATPDGKPEGKRRGAPKGHRGASRPVPDKIDEERTIPPPEACSCGCGHILPLNEYDDVYVEDIPVVPKVVTRLRHQRGTCSQCGATARHAEAVSGPPVVIGPNLGIFLTMARQAGVTYRKLAALSADLFGIPLTASGALGIVGRHAELLRPVYDEIGAALRVEPVLNLDETGWRIALQGGYIWCACSPRLAWFHPDTSRAGQVARDFVGENFAGTVVCDFYGGYNSFRNLQRCLVHFMRDLHAERVILPGSKQLERFEAALWQLIADGQEIGQLSEGEAKDLQLAELEAQLDRITRMPVTVGKATTLRNRLRKHRDELLAFARTPGVEYHNNRAEREVRPTVVNRKNSFGSDSEAGAQHTCILNSVVQTCKLNGQNPAEFVRAVSESSGELPPSIFPDPATD